MLVYSKIILNNPYVTHSWEGEKNHFILNFTVFQINQFKLLLGMLHFKLGTAICIELADTELTVFSYKLHYIIACHSLETAMSGGQFALFVKCCITLYLAF